MPTYEFKCKVCDKRYYYSQNKMTAYCCEQELVRVWGATGIHFKGNGFYRTDYKTKS